ncbi:MAG: FAD:protein FMN transferase, partial [Bacteroidota bacterium]
SIWGDGEQQIKVKVINKAVAISGRQAVAHPERIVDPAPGTSTRNRLLAAVVIAPDCISADAYATAMMVRGLTDAQKLVASQEELAAFLVYEDDHGAPVFYTSPGLEMCQKRNQITLQLAQQEG